MVPVNKLAVFATIGLVIAILATIVTQVWPSIYSNIINKRLSIQNGSEEFLLWRDESQVKMELKVYLFNCTNPQDVLEKKDKPKLVELGPYVFREYRNKVDLEWTPNHTVKYYLNRTFIFDESQSQGSLNDHIVTLNVPAMTAASTASEHMLLPTLISGVFELLKIEPFVNHTAGEFIFEGYKDDLIDFGRQFPQHYLQVPFDKFGWFYPRNGSAEYDGHYEMYTGKDDIFKVGLASNWKNHTKTSYYNAHCSMVNGSFGEIWPPNQTPNSLTMFSSDICRSVTLPFEKDIYINGVKGYRFIGDEKMLANTTTNSNNWCYCKNHHCWPNGVLDISTCKYGAPLLLSYPHFLYADPIFAEAIYGGLQPNKSIHQTFMDIEPATGIPMKAAGRFQVNLWMKPAPGVKHFSDLPTIVFPMMWFSESAEVPDELLIKIWFASNLTNIVCGSMYVIMTIGYITCLVILVGFFHKKFMGKINEEENGLIIGRDTQSYT